MKPIIVAGIDFSGTSMVAGLLHAAGIDMGDVESAKEVAASTRPVRYQTFEDKALKKRLEPLAKEMFASLPNITTSWLDRLYQQFTQYIILRTAEAQGKQWGVKNNGLLFLAMHPRFDEIPVQWVTTCRPLEESMDSCFDKLGFHSRYAAMMGVEYLAWRRFAGHPSTWSFSFHDFLYGEQRDAKRLCRLIQTGGQKSQEILDFIDPETKGVIPCRGLSQPQP